jgi:hypothetical protein
MAPLTVSSVSFFRFPMASFQVDRYAHKILPAEGPPYVQLVSETNPPECICSSNRWTKDSFPFKKGSRNSRVLVVREKVAD